MDVESIFRGRQNILRWKMLSNGREFDMTSNGVTSASIFLGAEELDSLDHPTKILVNGIYLSAQLGEILPEGLVDGCYEGRIVLYSSNFPSGKVWKELTFEVK